MKDCAPALMIISLIVALFVLGWFCGVSNERCKASELILADMYLAPPPGQMQGMDPNDLSVRQAWTSTILRQTVVKTQQDIANLMERMIESEAPNNAVRD